MNKFTNKNLYTGCFYSTPAVSRCAYKSCPVAKKIFHFFKYLVFLHRNVMSSRHGKVSTFNQTLKNKGMTWVCTHIL